MNDRTTQYRSLAMRLGLDFVSGVLVGTLLGRAVDIYFGTYPWGLVIFIVLGIMAGSLNIYRLLQNYLPKKGEK